MSQTLLETLTKKQLFVFTLLLLLGVSAFFILGGIKGADPATASIHIANLFVVNQTKSKYDFSDKNDWLWYRVGKNSLDNQEKNHLQGYRREDNFVKMLHDGESITPENLVFATKFPHPGSFPMHKGHQFMLVVMSIQMLFLTNNIDVQSYRPDATFECNMHFSAKLGYSDEENGLSIEKWTELSRVLNESRPLKCFFSRLGYDNDTIDGYYTCDDLHLFELGSVAHKHYLINMQFPVTEYNKNCLASQERFFNGVHLTEIHQNYGYTISLFVAKTVMFPFIVAAFLFFYRRVKRERRDFLLLEKSIVALNVATIALLLPLDWLTLAFDFPLMLLISDIRQGLFYGSLLTFWSLFAGEHIMDQNKRNQIQSYKVEIGCITIGCLSLLIFDLVERGLQLSNPFHTIWKKDIGETIARTFIWVAAAAVLIYGLFFIRLLWFVQRNIRMMSSALPAMQERRRFYYQNRIYRFRVLLWVTLLLVAMTVGCFITDQLNETSWKFEDNSLNDYVIVSSALHFGMFGMWSAYVFAVTALYSPSGKAEESDVQYSQPVNLLNSQVSEDDDEVQFRHPKT